MVIQLYILGLILFWMFFGWIARRRGNSKGKKYRPCTPLIVFDPTGVNDKYKPVQINITIDKIVPKVTILCFLVRKFPALSVMKMKISVIIRMR